MDAELKEYLESIRTENAAAHAETRHQFEVMTERLEGKIALVAEGVVGSNERIDRLDAKVDGLETKVDRLETKVDHLETKVDHLETKVDHLETKFDHLETKFDHLETKVDHLETKVDHLETNLERLDGKVDHLADEMKSGFADLRSMITISHTQLDSRVRKLEQR